SGQVCSAGSRILAQRKVYDEVVERLTARARAIRVGDPASPDTTMGPVVSAAQMKTVLDYVEIGKRE
ncbi:MAG TPA: betaine-aldehyde dehydrogenase, partial [Cupriavidus sp.]|nr:betaine-aldehyde dehydrogenase [Cupriavidus sp.]